MTKEDFGRALGALLHPNTDVTQTWLAKQLGVTQSAVSGWVRGSSPPEPPERVFEIERLLGVPPGALSQMLGYVPVGATPTAAVTGILADPHLTDGQRKVFLALLEELTGSPPAEEPKRRGKRSAAG